MPHSTSRDGVEKKPETVELRRYHAAMRAARGVLGGWMVGKVVPWTATRNENRRDWYVSVHVHIEGKTIDKMLRRERAQAKKADAKGAKRGKGKG